VARERNDLTTKKGAFDLKTQERQQLSKQVNPLELSKINVIDQRDKANHLFEWVLEAIYQEPISKYYWTNFKNQTLLKDGGQNLVDRLEHFKVATMTTSAAEATEVLISEKNTVEEAIKKGKPLPPSVEVLFKILENISVSRKIYVEYTEHEKKMKNMIDEHQYVKLEMQKYTDVQQCTEQRIKTLRNCNVHYNNLLQALLRQETKMQSSAEIAKTEKLEMKIPDQPKSTEVHRDNTNGMNSNQNYGYQSQNNNQFQKTKKVAKRR